MAHQSHIAKYKIHHDAYMYSRDLNEWIQSAKVYRWCGIVITLYTVYSGYLGTLLKVLGNVDNLVVHQTSKMVQRRLKTIRYHYLPLGECGERERGRIRRDRVRSVAYCPMFRLNSYSPNGKSVCHFNKPTMDGSGIMVGSGWYWARQLQNQLSW